MKRTFASFSFGCRVNQAEKEEIDRQLLSAGFLYDEKRPDFYIINSCAVTGKAEREVRQFIYQIRRKYPGIKIYVTGCAATLWALQKRGIDGANFLIENKNKQSLTDILERRFYPTPSRNPFGHLEGAACRSKFTDSGRIPVKIQDGCQRFCTYCIVPYLRGQPKSRTIEEVIKQINGEKNIKEAILTAINTEAFGLDTGESFVKLLESTILKTNIPRISLGSINPWSIDDKFYNFYKKYNLSGRLVNFFHVPLQSGSNKVLELMNRGYTREEFREKIKRVHDINPLAFIATDVIVGFLDETDSDFEKTYNFLEKSPISKFHVFRYSPREKTAAYYLRKNHKESTEAVKRKRAKILSELGKKKYKQFLDKHLKKTFPALFLVRRKESYQEVLLDNQIPAWIKTAKDLSKDINPVRITRMKDNFLFGVLA